MGDGLMDAKAVGEDAVRELTPRLPYTIVRLGGMGAPQPPPTAGEEPPLHRLEVGQGDDLRGRLSRDDAAACVAAVVRTPGAARSATFEVVCSKPTTLAPDGHHAKLLGDSEPD
mmetsp:Transcript_1989/g.6212  ORF Transcript_1989/g.6212 Transcript_1989/m.6212 type:complete len:114 (-) Transcript_1989:42-383(-)